LAGRDHFSTEELLSVAQRLTLDPAEVESALSDHSFREPVVEDMAGGRKAGVHGTPTFFLGAERLEGHWRQLAQLVPATLQKVNAARAADRHPGTTETER
jgi:2-hydroxychromene-2-carboxylate isomerase